MELVAARDPSSLFGEILKLHVRHLSSADYFSMVAWYDNKCIQPTKFQDFLPLPSDFFKLRPKVEPPIINGRSLRSSGTTGIVSSISLDLETSKLQRRAFVDTWLDWIPNQRVPMIFFAPKRILQGEERFTAKGAALTAMMQFASETFWLESDDPSELLGLMRHLSSSGLAPRVICFGFTSDVWTFFRNNESQFKIPEGLNVLLIHGGGWKKLEHQKVSKAKFQELLLSCGLERVMDYYGMVEQLGGIWIEGPDGNFLPSKYSGAIIRDPITLEQRISPGEQGLIQSFSSLTLSYPGHSLLTNDIGAIVKNSFKPELFGPWALRVDGRIPRLEPRGCSDAT